MAYFILICVLLAPTYAVRFTVLEIPTNLLMAWNFLVMGIFTAWLAGTQKFTEFAKFKISLDKKILLPALLFFAAGVFSLFVNDSSIIKKLGQFIVLFLQPLALFFTAAFVWQQTPKGKQLFINILYGCAAVSGLYAAVQYFTLLGLPEIFWGNAVEPKRAVSFFTHPNFYALFIAPLLAFLVPDMLKEFSILNLQFSKNWKPTLWLLGAFGLLLSLSRAGWLGLGAAIAVYTLVAGNKQVKKIVAAAAVVAVIVIVSTPNLRYRFLLPFYGEKSAVSRISLWSTGWKGIKESPVTGLGLTGFSQNWNRLNSDPGLTEAHNFPHNIFLDLWVETGLLGLASFVFLCALLIWRGVKNKLNIPHLSVALFLITLLVQGLIDNPYFKNDLALIFWIILSLAI